MSYTSPFDERRPWNGGPYHDALPSSVYAPLSGLSGRSFLEADLAEARGDEAEGRAGFPELAVDGGDGTTGGGVLAATGCLAAQPATAIAAQHKGINVRSCSLQAARLLVTLRLDYAEVSLLFE
jgi:hypothetical protein